MERIKVGVRDVSESMKTCANIKIYGKLHSIVLLYSYSLIQSLYKKRMTPSAMKANHQLFTCHEPKAHLPDVRSDPLSKKREER